VAARSPEPVTSSRSRTYIRVSGGQVLPALGVFSKDQVRYQPNRLISTGRRNRREWPSRRVPRRFPEGRCAGCGRRGDRALPAPGFSSRTQPIAIPVEMGLQLSFVLFPHDIHQQQQAMLFELRVSPLKEDGFVGGRQMVQGEAGKDEIEDLAWAAPPASRPDVIRTAAPRSQIASA